ncbi:hypothetical protein [Streptomyces sp. NPDC049744]|uniref:hypothetical protein n=1 Tax=Streptomyces sp. NPDC049744 TaxID=3154359 RepID=UPI00343E9994
MAEAAGGSSSDQPPRKWREVIKHSITGLTALGIFGALVFQGVGTYLQYLVSKDQLAQSQEANGERIRAQASKIAVWRAWEVDKGEVQIQVMNRSLDPIGWLTVAMEGDYLAGGKVYTGTYTFGFGSVPPCTLLTISGKDGFYHTRSQKARQFINIKIDAIDFADTVGRHWYETDGEITQDQTAHIERGERRLTAIREGEYAETGNLEVQKVKTSEPAGCGEN